MLEVLPSPISKAAADQLPHVVDDDVGFLTSTDDDHCESFMGDDNLLDYIDFTCCDVVPSFFDADGDILPDLEVDPTELLAEFEDHRHEEDKQGTRTQGEASSSQQGEHKEDENKRFLEEGGGQKKISSGDEVLSAENTSKSSSEGQIISKKKEKPSKNSNGKRKVDWTPELHRRFVQAVEQLGIDKAVPSRILEIIGIECLTRHNIASHLQAWMEDQRRGNGTQCKKYRSHRNHLMAREAEAASWAQKRQMYAAAAAPMTTTTTTKDIMPAPWVVPTVGFPRPLHVWGHPPTAAAPVDPAAAPYTYWQQQQQCNGAMKWGPHAVPPTMMPSSTTAAMQLPRFPVPGMMPHPMYRPPLIMPPSPSQTAAGSKLATVQLQLDAHPSKESIDAAIGDVLVKPWMPLPLGLKPPSLDSVMSELHKQGIPKIPPAATTTGSQPAS